MAKVKRSFHEAVWQKVLPHSMQSKDFVPLSNARNEAMFAEAAQFAKWLTTVERDVLLMEKTIDKFMLNSQSFMQSSLPRVYEENVPGQAVATEVEPQPVGGSANLEQLALAPEELKSKMSSDVLQPLRNWLIGFNNIKRRMKQVENLRLEVDSRRRTAANMGGKLTRQRTQHYKKGTDSAAAEEKLEKQDTRVKHKTAKANSAYTQYRELELDTYNQLSDLVKDTVYIRQYMAEAMLVVADSFNMAYEAFNGKVPLKENRMPPQEVVSSRSEAYGHPKVQNGTPKSATVKVATSDNADVSRNPFARQRSSVY
eukprot:TRINITY_DN14793_c1_g1_i2.p1 TRINITY_DN14793_c1_g1~~TRINITY_DN14793_c1_g1_i2.p1  ORF type:complete len:313 (+),score=54.87 TRINITY_DN14793_c1_g1_i2:83-1021(+)